MGVLALQVKSFMELTVYNLVQAQCVKLLFVFKRMWLGHRQMMPLLQHRLFSLRNKADLRNQMMRISRG